ncbi:MAG: DUF3368 domain-containing protein, partial [Spirosoma sp.]|nr:DUF3368 domain-containing protein [Spirosoma sp.]
MHVFVTPTVVREYGDQKYLGTLGLILRAKRLGVIPFVRPLLEKVKQTDFWANDRLLDYILLE